MIGLLFFATGVALWTAAILITDMRITLRNIEREIHAAIGTANRVYTPAQPIQLPPLKQRYHE